MERLHRPAQQGVSDDEAAGRRDKQRVGVAYQVLRSALAADVTVAGMALLVAATGASVVEVALAAVGAVATVNAAAIGVAGAAVRGLNRGPAHLNFYLRVHEPPRHWVAGRLGRAQRS